MKLLFEHKKTILPKLSIILIDWSCRDSFHILHYLNNQTVPREKYEIIWIEYYSRRHTEIETMLKDCEKSGKSPAVDKWIVMGIPENIYYHKHLMFNIGIIASKGKILTFCDSDAIFRERFIEEILGQGCINRGDVFYVGCDKR